MDEEQNLEKMRYDSLLKIARTMGGAALSGAVPTPTLELAKQLGISIADAWMCFDIYKTYFGKELSKRELIQYAANYWHRHSGRRARRIRWHPPGAGVVERDSGADPDRQFDHHRHRLWQLDLHHRARLAGNCGTEAISCRAPMKPKPASAPTASR